MERKVARTDIRNFLVVLGCGVLVAFLAVFWMVRVEGYERGIYVREVLLSPETMEMISNRAVKVGGKEFARYLVESIDYSYYNKGKWDMATIDIGPYQALWAEVSGDRGTAHPDPEIVKLFDDQKVSNLAIYVRREMPYQKEGLNELFQQMQVPLQGDYYRIQMHDNENTGTWVYFYHPGIQSEILEAIKKNG